MDYIVLQKGKLYQFTVEMNVMSESDFKGNTKVSTFFRDHVTVEKDTIFMFLETVRRGQSDFSKILIRDQKYFTYNEYLLRGFLVECPNERILSTSSKTND